MVPNVTAILQRFTTEWAALLPPEAILAACGEAGDTTWRDRVLTPVTTIQVFLMSRRVGLLSCQVSGGHLVSRAFHDLAG